MERGAGRSDMAALVRRAQAGDRAAFDELYRRTAQAQYFTIVGWVGRQAAPDILQELYLVAWDNRASIQPAAFVGYLNATARNLCKRYFKARGSAKVPLAAEDEMLESAAEGAVAAPAPLDPALQADERDETARLARALREALDDQERDAVLMRYYQNMKLDEIAASLEVSRATVKRILNRALSTLRHKMGALPVGVAFADVLVRAVEEPAAPGMRAEALGRGASAAPRRDGAAKLVGAAAVALTVGAVLFAAMAPRPEAMPEQPTPLAEPAPAPDTTGPVLVESATRDGVTLLYLADESGVAEVFCVGDDGARFDAVPANGGETDRSAWEVRLPSGTWQLHARDAVGNESVGTLATHITPDAF